MTTETDTEFERGLSPHTIHHDPRLPSQHTLDARQLRVLHRAIDTLAFTAEQYRAALPRGVAELIDATVGAWQPVMTELIEQQDRFRRGGLGMSEPIAKSEWRWFGDPGHLIVSEDCRFHLCTQVGPWLVSTVGKYLPDAPVREIEANHRGIELHGKGDRRRADYMNKIGYQTVGLDRLYETMVFRAGSPCDAEGCHCGMPTPDDFSEYDMEGYNNAGDATRGHMAMCDKWAAISVDQARGEI